MQLHRDVQEAPPGMGFEGRQSRLSHQPLWHLEPALASSLSSPCAPGTMRPLCARLGRTCSLPVPLGHSSPCLVQKTAT